MASPRHLSIYFCLFDSTQQAFLLTCFHLSADSRFAFARLLILAISSIASPTRHAASVTLLWAACTSRWASSSNLLASSILCCTRSSAVRPSNVRLECGVISAVISRGTTLKGTPKTNSNITVTLLFLTPNPEKLANFRRRAISKKRRETVSRILCVCGKKNHCRQLFFFDAVKKPTNLTADQENAQATLRIRPQGFTLNP